MDNTKLLTEAQIEAIEEVAELVRKCVEYIADVLVRVAKCLHNFIKELVENFTNKRVIHLATHHGNPRVRKKNVKRLVKWMRRFVQCNE